MSGEIFKEIEYIDTNNLKEKLTYLLEEYIYDPEYIRLIFNNEILNNPEEHDINFYKINNFNLEDLQENNYISIILCEKKTLFFIENDNGKYEINPIYKCYSNDIIILFSLNENKEYLDHYIALLNIIYYYYDNNYDIILNSTYKNLILLAINKSNEVTGYITDDMKNDNEIILAIVRRSGDNLYIINTDIINYKEVVLEAVKQNGLSLLHAKLSLNNDKDVVSEAVKQNGLALKFASSEMRNNKEVVLKAIKQNKSALQFASKKLKKNDIIISAIKEL